MDKMFSFFENNVLYEMKLGQTPGIIDYPDMYIYQLSYTGIITHPYRYSTRAKYEKRYHHCVNQTLLQI